MIRPGGRACELWIRLNGTGVTPRFITGGRQPLAAKIKGEKDVRFRYRTRDKSVVS